MPGVREASGAGARRPSVGIVGGGQLARMTCEAASPLDVDTVVLAEQADDAAVRVASEVVIGSPTVDADVEALAERCDVITFDHEQVDLGLLAHLVGAGRTVAPGLTTLEMAVDKSVMRRRLRRAGIPVPAFVTLPTTGVADGQPGTVQPDEAAAAIDRFAEAHGWPLVLKAARGGYDGNGVWPVDDRDAAEAVLHRARGNRTPLLLEERVAIDAELAVLVARRPGGGAVAWPAVETAQIDGVCREVLVPGRIDAAVTAAATALAKRVADEAQSVGVLAVELFLAAGELLVNEVAARPHNSGHWTIEGATTSQFENHLRAILDLPLGDTAATADCVASVNVLGAADGTDPATRLADALAIPGAHVHLYGKAPRPGRKLGHVTVLGSDHDDVRARAWAAAGALGSPVPDGLDIDRPPA